METTRKFELELTEDEVAMIIVALTMLTDELDVAVKRADRLDDPDRAEHALRQQDAAWSAARKLSAASWTAR